MHGCSDATPAWAAFSWRKLTFFPPSSYTLPIAHWLRVGLHDLLPNPCWNFAWLDSVQAVHMQLTPVMSSCILLPCNVQNTPFHSSPLLTPDAPIYLPRLLQWPSSLQGESTLYVCMCICMYMCVCIHTCMYVDVHMYPI